MARVRKWPPLPSRVRAPGGWVPIVRPDAISEDGVNCLGLWRQDDRQIEILASLTAEQAWRIYYHECAHMALTDGGLEDILLPTLGENAIEAICNAFAAQRMSERFR